MRVLHLFSFTITGLICRSSDNDGIIDPIDCCPTARHLADFEKRLLSIVYPYYEKSLHVGKIFIDSREDLESKLRRVFYDNLKEFAVKYSPTSSESGVIA